ncbi:class I SAM-dependent methyltransferase [Variovorax sp. J22P168]|uniref:class I SAM-dependent methyltransferase n=1 Tax=Variovorax jilinensis TaxID=3053513 RepID=UPI00257673A5|nr:class I SAM-dependent methyltransferase [Variovorax sp. J22P168]MDM0014620.1 class I SAM-dependent methyltransferase [Variovorax sp. J22P168]
MTDAAAADASAGSDRYFDDLYGASEDPYGLCDRWYERRKRALILAALPQPRYRCAFEPGCGIGAFTLALAGRCDELEASDRSARAVELARQRTAQLPHVHVTRQDLPADWPQGSGRFDLIVVAELGYFLDDAAMQALARCCADSLTDDGTLVACDWRPDFAERKLATDAVHAHLEALAMPRLLRHVEDDFALQVWCRDGRSVAQREAIR